MSSNVLTRTVMRRIIANLPIRHHDLVASCHLVRKPLLRSRCHGPRIQTRSLFPMLSRSPGAPTVYNLSRREMTLRKHAKTLHEAYMLILVNTRTPAKADLENTFKTYFEESEAAQELVTDHQAGILLRVFNFLVSSEQGDSAMSVPTAKAALVAMSRFDHEKPDNGMLHGNPPFEDQYWVLVQQLVGFIRKHDQNADPGELQALEFQCFAKSGHAELYEEQIRSVKDLELWKLYIKSQFSDPSTILDSLKVFQEHGPQPDDELTSLFVQGFLHAGQSDLARRMLHGSGLLKAEESSLKPAADILKTCVQNNDSPTAVEIIAKVDQATTSNSQNITQRSGLAEWTLQLARQKVNDRSADDVSSVLQQLLVQFEQPLAIATFNALVEDAYGADHPDTAKAIIEFAQEHDLQLNGYTFLPQVLHKLRNGDLDGALATWDYILYDLEPIKTEDMADVMEELLRAILSAPDFREDQFDEIMENHPKYARRFRPETVSALVEFYMRNDEFENAALLMRKHAPGLTSAARLMLLDRVMAICHDTTVSDECVWNVYNMIKALFDEAPRHLREQILGVTLDRHMKDRALEIFRSMRDHWLVALQPREETYLLALSGFEQSWHGTQTVHNSLKVDVRVDSSTKLLNALMRAYTRCGQDEARAAVDFWDHVLELKPGPDEDSVVCVLEACTVSPVGLQQADHVWDTLEKRNLAKSERVLGAYINNLILSVSEEAKSSLEQQVKRHVLDHTLVLECMNASAVGDSQKLQISRWLEREYPTFWSSPRAQVIRQETDAVRKRLQEASLEED